MKLYHRVPYYRKKAGIYFGDYYFNYLWIRNQKGARNKLFCDGIRDQKGATAILINFFFLCQIFNCNQNLTAVSSLKGASIIALIVQGSTSAVLSSCTPSKHFIADAKRCINYLSQESIFCRNLLSAVLG